ncbi:MAG: DUF4932 domain-containing protein [Candidatus Aminicenantes bacterium]|nr:DUF4932 domain-containing protein [Candidatus Aminicenantes bacterium]
MNEQSPICVPFHLPFLSIKRPNHAISLAVIRESHNSFFWVRDLSNLLGEYEAHRGKYPNLDSFFPEIVEFFDKYAASIR